ncbi:MAG: MoaD/ThiS family protein [Gallionellaceae bacterium]|jgi:molybdopterin synthase sulfur carrier subunit
MQIKILYFGRPAEALKLAEETVEVPANVATMGDLLAWLRTRDDVWARELLEARLKGAINQQFSGWDARIKAGDEVALFSPISGG